MCVCLSVCLSVYVRYCTDPDVTWESGRGCPLVVHCWADLQSVHWLRCYGNTRNAWQSPAVIRQARRTLHALRMLAKTPLASDKIDAPAAYACYLQRGRSISSILQGYCNAKCTCYVPSYFCYGIHGVFAVMFLMLVE